MIWVCIPMRQMRTSPSMPPETMREQSFVGASAVTPWLCASLIAYSSLPDWGQEGADLAVRPAGQNAAAVVHELDGEALEAWDLDAEELLPGLGVPDSDVVDRARREQVRVAGGERDVVNALEVAGVPELGGDAVRVAPVDGGLGGAGEEVRRVSRERDRGDGAHDLGLRLELHRSRGDQHLRDGAVASADQQVTVV